MNANLQKLCEDFVVNREAAAKAFMFDYSYIYPVVANIFTAYGRTTTPEELKESRRVIEENTGFFSNFRGNIRPLLAATLALSADAQSQMQLAKDYYQLLKQEFLSSEYLALAAFLLTELVNVSQLNEKIERGKTLFKRMKKEHPFLTGTEDSVLAVLMAFSEKSDDALIEDMERCYQALKGRFSIGDALQTVSHVLALADGRPEDKADRLITLYNALRDAGIKYGKNYELPTLAVLSLVDAPIETLVQEIAEVDAFLKTQKGYGILMTSAQQRAMHAAMIVSDQYAPRERVNIAAMASTIAMIVATEIAMYAAIAASSAASAAN